MVCDDCDLARARQVELAVLDCVAHGEALQLSHGVPCLRRRECSRSASHKGDFSINSTLSEDVAQALAAGICVELSRQLGIKWVNEQVAR